MLDAALLAVPKEKKTAATHYLFVLLFEQRQGALAFLSVIAGAIYGMQLPLENRAVLHLLLFSNVRIVHAGQCQSCRYSFLR